MNRKERRSAAKRGAGVRVTANPAEAEALFAEAVRLHQMGRGFDAEAACRAAVARDGAHAGALHLLGVVAMQRGLPEEAVGHFTRAAEIRPDIAIGQHNLGKALAASGRPEAAAGAFERAVVLQPDLAEAHNHLGVVRLSQGLRKEASASFARAMQLLPELTESFQNTLATLFEVNPALREGVARVGAAWPRPLPIEEMLGTAGLAAIADDAMLLGVLRSGTLRDPQLEHYFTTVRTALLRAAAIEDGGEDGALPFHCALAAQCFNNEYVFAESAEEAASVERQAALLGAALDTNAAIPPLRLAAVAAYRPLSSLPGARRLLDRAWPEPVDALLTQQIRNAEAEARNRETTARLTPIEGDVTAAVRQQYEENPYPRWVAAPSQPTPLGLDEHLRIMFPRAPLKPLGDRALDVLIAGCGTGQQSIGTARRYRNLKILALDLSLSSLAYAQRMTRELGVTNIDYAQADVMALGSIGRTFDVIDVSGVLHHLSDPAEGWRVLLGLLRPGGLMRIGLYSQRGRADVIAVREFIAQRGFQPTQRDIRLCRQELLATPLLAVARFRDFFSTSECRDLLFHVQEHRFNIPQIAAFLAANKLTFVGFDLTAVAPVSGVTMPNESNLEAWDAFERDHPETFSGMYQFWCQRA